MVGLNKCASYAPAVYHPIYIELDGIVKLDIEIEWAAVLATFLANHPSGPRSADPLAAAKLRTDNNLRSVFG